MQIKNRRCSISDSGAAALPSFSKAGFRQTLLCDGKVPLSPALLTDALEELRPREYSIRVPASARNGTDTRLLAVGDGAARGRMAHLLEAFIIPPV